MAHDEIAQLKEELRICREDQRRTYEELSTLKLKVYTDYATINSQLEVLKTGQDRLFVKQDEFFVKFDEFKQDSSFTLKKALTGILSILASIAIGYIVARWK